MYEMLVEYKELIMGMGSVAIIILSGLAIMSAWMFQGTHTRSLTGPLYSTYICVSIVALFGVVANYLVFIGGKIPMALGIGLFVFCMMILFTVSVLCWVAMNHKPSSTKIQFGMFQR